ncbi:hypothetical protein [Bosea sp. (in: a-proteobacteria)]|jgi:hypothetical protein|uniref:hypothetical protein n=1 Tax=Bosea sp. (in: a-proteobacteria) TaxID=1871050 RepID=UPI002DDCAD46|nr:hypothetical protein [Bosea sp. (in: a-proteobacteria)]HEV2508636.1 hypothetical protein [Bosea sp. (in: a-proteobacteria)]
MIEGADELPLAGFRQSAEAESVAPPLPYGKFLVGSVQAAQLLQNVSAQMQTLLLHAPGDRETFNMLHGQALDAWCAVDEQFNAFHAVRECKGQA